MADQGNERDGNSSLQIDDIFRTIGAVTAVNSVSGGSGDLFDSISSALLSQNEQYQTMSRNEQSASEIMKSLTEGRLARIDKINMAEATAREIAMEDGVSEIEMIQRISTARTEAANEGIRGLGREMLGEGEFYSTSQSHAIQIMDLRAEERENYLSGLDEVTRNSMSSLELEEAMVQAANARTESYLDGFDQITRAGIEEELENETRAVIALREQLNFESEFEELRSGFEEVKNTFLGGGLLQSLPFIATIAAAIDLQNDLRKTAIATAGVMGNEYERASRQVIDSTIELGISQTDALAIMESFSDTGLFLRTNTAEIKELTMAARNMAFVFDMGADEAAQITNTLAVWGLKGKSIDDLTGKVSNMAKSFGLSGKEAGEVLGRISTWFTDLGITSEDLGEKLGKAFIKIKAQANSAGISAESSFSTLDALKNTTDGTVRYILRELGGTLDNGIKMMMNSPDELINEFNKNIQRRILKGMGGIEAMTSMSDSKRFEELNLRMKMISDMGIKGFDEDQQRTIFANILKASKDAKGGIKTLEEAYDIAMTPDQKTLDANAYKESIGAAMGTIGELVSQLKDLGQAFLVEIGAPIAKVLTPILGMLVSSLRGIGSVMKDIPFLAEAISTAIGVLMVKKLISGAGILSQFGSSLFNFSSSFLGTGNMLASISDKIKSSAMSLFSYTRDLMTSQGMLTRIESIRSAGIAAMSKVQQTYSFITSEANVNMLKDIVMKGKDIALTYTQIAVNKIHSAGVLLRTSIQNGSLIADAKALALRAKDIILTNGIALATKIHSAAIAARTIIQNSSLITSAKTMALRAKDIILTNGMAMATTALATAQTLGSKAASMVAAGISRAGLLLAANPIGATVLGITAAVTGLYYAFKNWGDVSSWLKDNLGSTGEFIVNSIEGIANLFDGLFSGEGGIGSEISSMFTELSDAVSPLFDALGKLGGVLGELFSSLFPVVFKAFSPILSLVGTLISPLISGISIVADIIGTVLGGAISSIVGIVSGVIGIVIFSVNTLTSMVTGIANFITSPFESIGGIISSSLESIGDVFELITKPFTETWEFLTELFDFSKLFDSVGDSITGAFDGVSDFFGFGDETPNKDDISEISKAQSQIKTETQVSSNVIENKSYQELANASTQSMFDSMSQDEKKKLLERVNGIDNDGIKNSYSEREVKDTFTEVDFYNKYVKTEEIRNAKSTPSNIDKVMSSVNSMSSSESIKNSVNSTLSQNNLSRSRITPIEYMNNGTPSVIEKVSDSAIKLIKETSTSLFDKYSNENESSIIKESSFPVRDIDTSNVNELSSTFSTLVIEKSQSSNGDEQRFSNTKEENSVEENQNKEIGNLVQLLTKDSADRKTILDLVKRSLMKNGTMDNKEMLSLLVNGAI